MTIAGVYLSPEGVVLGADSTSSIGSGDGLHFFDFNQKLFELGEDSTLGLITWGLGGLGGTSYRTIIAVFADDLKRRPPADFNDVMSRWIDVFWAEYTNWSLYTRFQSLNLKSPFGQPPAGQFGTRSQGEEEEWATLGVQLRVGFCVAGYVLPSRTPEAQSVSFSPSDPKPTPIPMPQQTLYWWGVPNFFTRLLWGADANVIDAISTSGKWAGSRQELDDIVRNFAIVPNGTLPIRDAVDYVHTCIYCTVKAIKFSGLAQVCGGPIELAVITSDRKFRWVRHKPWDSAINEGGII